MALLILCYAIVAGFASYEFYSQYMFRKNRDSIKYRVHVTGVRGKSSVTRYVAAILRDAGLETYAKTAGYTSRIVLPNDTDIAIARQTGTAYVNEQVEAVRNFGKRKAQAIVVECAKVSPRYHHWLEHRIMRSHIIIVTGLEVDQITKRRFKNKIDQNKLESQNLPRVARRLARSIPEKSVVIIDEHRPELMKIFAEACKRNNSRLITVGKSFADVSSLPYANHIVHRDRLAVALAVGKLLQIPNDRSLRAIARARPEPTAARLEHFSMGGKSVVWANLFAINESQKLTEFVYRAAKQYPDHELVILLNNRVNRPARLIKFTKIAQTKCHANVIVALGESEGQVESLIKRKGTRFVAMGSTSKYALADGSVLMEAIVNQASKQQVLVVGAVNAHTVQSDQLVRYVRSIANQTNQKPFPYV